MKLTTKLRPLVAATAIGMATMAAPLAHADSFTGNIGVVSKYILRGITNSPENDNAALQGGLDYGFDNGIYLGYWGSSLGYSDPGKSNGFENDLYGGYAGKFGGFSYDVGVIYYKYVNIDNADGAELKGTVGYGPFTLGANYLTKDVTWGNKGDTYWTVDYSHDLPKGFSFDALLGYYTYKDSGKYIASSAKSGAFRHLNLSLSHPIGNTGADWNVTYIIGGKDRDGVDQKNAVTLGVSYGFDIK
ncbi:MAG: TorF family putative porin [Gammaproteobacteria bacterium]